MEAYRSLIDRLVAEVGMSREWVESVYLPSLRRLPALLELTEGVPEGDVQQLERLLARIGERAGADDDTGVPAQEEQDRGEAEAAMRARHEQWDEELSAFLRLRPELQRKYPGKFVAFEDGKVIAVGDTGQATAEEACRLTGQIKSRLVRHVDESDDAVDVVHVRLDKPRSVEMEIEQ